VQQETRIAILKRLFDCSEEVAGKVNAAMHHKCHQNNEAILHQGDETSRCHLVVNGLAKARLIGVDGQDIQVATYQNGEIFGAYPTADKQRADITAAEDLELLTIDSSELSKMAQELANVGGGLSRIFAGQLDMMFDRLSARSLLSAEGRVYQELLQLADEDFRISPPPVVRAIAVSVQTTRETASRHINELVRRGILTREPTHWQIVAPRQLEDMIA
jgi:CRP/FNR family transcriptional regulator, cyclic AMP receptor protein